MKIWIDILTPKHALFFEPLYRDFAREGHELLLTTRTYREAEEALELKRLRYYIVGEHGGATRYGKLLASGRRVVKLAQLVESWHPDTAVSFSSPEAARVAFGPVAEEILKLKLDAQIVISTRYGRQAPVLRQKFGNKVRVIDHIVDSTSLLYYSTIFIGSGGTMTVEAALLGRPAISCFPGDKPLYIKYLEKKGLVKTIQSPRTIAMKVRETLASDKEMVEQ